MHDARDADDTRRLEAGEYSALVESYYGVILDRVRVRVWPEDQAIAVAAEVAIRLLSELKRGRRYRVPFRVVVHQVITWKVKEHYAPAKLTEVELEDWLAVASTESTDEIDLDDPFESWIAPLTELEQTVLRLHYVEDIGFAEIARMLGKEPNAVHQIHHRALTKLRREAA
jgi:RNA polymerase sigma factor (sigma-70 family)